MTNYERWALEYKKSADELRSKIDMLEYRRKYYGLSSQYEKKLLTMYCMYSDCMLAYKELMSKAAKVKGGKNEK